MNNRLKLAKKLLKPRGVLICTIDENEHATLGLLLQEIFPDKEIVCITIVHNPAGVQGKNFSYTHEYAYFIYPKNGEYIGKTTRENELVSPLRDWGTISKREQAKTCFYPIVVKENKIIRFEDVCPDDFHPESSNVLKKDGTIWIYPIDKHGIERKWVFSKKGVEKIKEQLFCKKIGKEYVIMRKKELFTYRTVWNDKRYYANIYGSKLLNQIIKSRFPFPKSLYAVADCIKAVIHNKADATILDFFAGSGTTGHAVLMLNDEDGGKRQFILSTNNENNICTDICYPRVKKVLQGYKSIKGEKVQGFGGNLKYYKTDFVGSEPTHRNKKLLTNKSIEMLCLKENTFDEVIDKKDFFIFKSEIRFTAILFNELKMEEFKKEIRKLKLPVSIYVFSLEGDDFKEEFEELQKDITLCSIPEAILKVYRRIYGTVKGK